jgi:hypothetical protein
MVWSEISYDPCHLGVPSCVFEMISKHNGTFGANLHLSCVKVSIISKRTKTSLHLRLVTKEYHRVPPKWFLWLWYLWSEPSTYLVSRLALSPNKSKWASIWASSPRNTIGCVQNELCGNGKLGANCAPYTNNNTISERTNARFHMTHVS